MVCTLFSKVRRHQKSIETLCAKLSNRQLRPDDRLNLLIRLKKLVRKCLCKRFPPKGYVSDDTTDVQTLLEQFTATVDSAAHGNYNGKALVKGFFFVEGAIVNVLKTSRESMDSLNVKRFAIICLQHENFVKVAMDTKRKREALHSIDSALQACQEGLEISLQNIQTCKNQEGKILSIDTIQGIIERNTTELHRLNMDIPFRTHFNDDPNKLSMLEYSNRYPDVFLSRYSDTLRNRAQLSAEIEALSQKTEITQAEDRRHLQNLASKFEETARKAEEVHAAGLELRHEMVSGPRDLTVEDAVQGVLQRNAASAKALAAFVERLPKL